MKVLNELKQVRKKIQKGKAQYGENVQCEVWDISKGKYVAISEADVDRMIAEAEQ